MIEKVRGRVGPSHTATAPEVIPSSPASAARPGMRLASGVPDLRLPKLYSRWQLREPGFIVVRQGNEEQQVIRSKDLPSGTS